MLLPSATLFAAELQSWRDTPYFYDTFNPDQTSWHPPQEKNIEEFFKHHQYFAIVYSAVGKQLAVAYDFLPGQGCKVFFPGLGYTWAVPGGWGVWYKI